jgi:hypothetical protein
MNANRRSRNSRMIVAIKRVLSELGYTNRRLVEIRTGVRQR